MSPCTRWRPSAARSSWAQASTLHGRRATIMTMQPRQGTRVTIAMPAFNEENYIETCISSVQAQDYPAELIEILVADGRSTDKTREILARMSAADPRIKMIDNPERLQAPGLNLLVKAATGDVI